MKKVTVATLAAGVIAAVAIGLATPAMADNGGSVALPPGGPVAVYPQDQSTGGSNPYNPSGVDPYVPYGVWTPR